MARVRDSGPSKDDELKWRAENIVQEAVKSSPEFKKAVRQTIKELKVTQKNASNIIRRKK